LIEGMNSLGASKADKNKFETLNAQKDNLFRKGAEELERFTKVNGKNQNILTQLKNIYGTLGDSRNFQRIKNY
jgi:tetratricopeptide repeat protein